MIRQANPEDASAISRIAREAYAVYVARLGQPPAPMIADFERHIVEDWVILFEEEGVVAGYAVLSMDEQRARLLNIAVGARHQRSGIGRALIERVERQAAAFGHGDLELYTNIVMTENIRWYQRLGYRETGEVVEDGFHRVYMRKDLIS